MQFDTKVIDSLRNGGVGVMPSDTVYGISCLAINKNAVERIYELKGRDYNMPFIILLADIKQAEQLDLRVQGLEPANKFWPAPLTLITPAGPNTPVFLHRGKFSLAVRIPNNDELRKLISQTGPIVSTSANPQGQPPAKTIAEAKNYFGDKIDFYVDAGTLDGPPSTIAEIKSGKLVVTRQGAFKLQDPGQAT